MWWLIFVFSLSVEGFSPSVFPATLDFSFSHSSSESSEIAPAIRGKGIAEQLGCFGCHGPEGSGGVANPGSPSGLIPGWDGETAAMYIKSETDIREWILYGVPLENRELGGSMGTGEKLIPMPGYEEHLTGKELDDLVAYFKAVSGWAPEIPDEAYEGRKVCEQFGCFGCHGPSGMGGIKNPGGSKGDIPAWDGEAYRELVHDESELREWILEGKIDRLWQDPEARRAFTSQKTQMPAYRNHLSQREVDRIVAYIHWLREKNDD